MKKRIFRNLILLLLGSVVLDGASEPGAPNIIVILADDLGYSDVGCYGGEIQTPVLDGLAESGLRFSQFYSCGRCWPSRTALISGYYPQQTKTDPLNWAQSREGTLLLPSFVRPLPAFLKPYGYRSYHSGKWHVKPGPDNVLETGGFDASYRAADHDRYFAPQKSFLQDRPLPPVTRPDFYLTTEITDRSLGFLQEHREQTPDRPFFLYVAYTAPHYPLQAPEEEIAKYRDLYRAGWDQIREQRYERLVEMGLVDASLPERMTDFRNYWGWDTEKLKSVVGPGETAANPYWKDLTAEEQEFQAAKMAVHAAMVDKMDQEIGRIVERLRQTDQLDNTLILFASDNGASAEMMVRGDGHDQNASIGSAGSYLCLGSGWACTANTPFRYSKGYVHEGGVASPLIVHWPDGIKDEGGLRRTPAHLVDILPTLADLAGGISDSVQSGDAPTLPGKSLVPFLSEDTECSRDELFFSHGGNFALRQGDWKAVKPRGGVWELYCLADDRSETHNLAQRYPERLERMIRRWEELNTEFLKEGQLERLHSSAEVDVPEQVFSGGQYEKLAVVPALTLSNDITWKMEVKVDKDCKPNAILMGNRHTPKTKATFFKVTPSKGVQLFNDGTELFRIPVLLPREVWTSVVIEKRGLRFLLYLDGKKVGEALSASVALAMPCYLGGDPHAPKEFARCSVRNAVVEVK